MATPSAPVHTESEQAASQWRKLSTTGGIVALIQLACVLTTIVAGSTVGWEPSSAQEYFEMFQGNRLEALLRLDFTTLIQLALFPLTAFGIYAALRHSHRAYAALTAALVIIGITLALASHSALSMIHLGDLYAVAGSEAEKSRLLAAAQAVIASDMWRSSSGLLAGLYMQGGLAFISVVMLRSTRFSKGTAITGLVSNGLDWVHVLAALVSPSLGEVLLWVAGPFYLLWFPLLARDLLRAGRSRQNRNAEEN